MSISGFRPDEKAAVEDDDFPGERVPLLRSELHEVVPQRKGVHGRGEAHARQKAVDGIEQESERTSGRHGGSDVVLGFKRGVPGQELQVGCDSDNPDLPDLFDAVRTPLGQGHRLREAPGLAGALFSGRLPAERALEIEDPVAVKLLQSPCAGVIPVAAAGVAQLKRCAEKVRELEKGASSLIQKPLPNLFQHLGRGKGLLESRNVMRIHAREDGRFFPVCL